MPHFDDNAMEIVGTYNYLGELMTWDWVLRASPPKSSPNQMGTAGERSVQDRKGVLHYWSCFNAAAPALLDPQRTGAQYILTWQ